jgi:hypothetical protein
MFTPKVAKTQKKAAESPTGKLAPQRSTFAARSFGGGAVEQAQMLQRSIGNQAMLRLMAQLASRSVRNEPGGDHEQEVAPENMAALEASRGVAWDFSKIPVFPPVRPNLARSPLSFTAAPSQLSRKSTVYEELQRDPVSPVAPDRIAPPIVHRVIGSSSRPLDHGSRNRFAPYFGSGLDAVRVHADSEAAASARAVRADAYTVGRHIVFGAGKYDPGTASGDGLIAHELAHVAQQRGQDPGPSHLSVAEADSVAEQEADRAAGVALSGSRPTGLTNSGPSLCRLPAQTDGQNPESETAGEQNVAAVSTDLQRAADQLRAGDSRPGPIVPLTFDLLSLFLRMGPRQPSLPSKFKGSPYIEIKGHAFIKGSTDTNEVDPNDVTQGQLGDCGLHAAMLAIARVNPQAIKDLITEKGDGTYDVTLYFKDHFWNNKTPHVINVKPTFPTDKAGNPLFSQPGDKGPDGPELWAMLIEKAFAMHAGGYDEAEGIWDRDALDLLSKADADELPASVNFLSEEMMGKLINAKLTSGHAVTANTSQSRWDRWTRSDADDKEIQTLGIVMNHAYSIVAVDESAKTLDLRNPWGFQHLTGLTFTAFRKYFNTWSWAKVK